MLGVGGQGEDSMVHYEFNLWKFRSLGLDSKGLDIESVPEASAQWPSVWNYPLDHFFGQGYTSSLFPCWNLKTNSKANSSNNLNNFGRTSWRR